MNRYRATVWYINSGYVTSLSMMEMRIREYEAESIAEFKQICWRNGPTYADKVEFGPISIKYSKE